MTTTTYAVVFCNTQAYYISIVLPMSDVGDDSGQPFSESGGIKPKGAPATDPAELPLGRLRDCAMRASLSPPPPSPTEST